MILQRILWVLALALLPAMAQGQDPAHPMPGGAGQMHDDIAVVPFYRERTFQFLAALAGVGVGVVAYRWARARWPGRAVVTREAVLVVDLVGSTRLATHHGDELAMRARNALKDRARGAAERHGVLFVENTGDGYLLTFPSVAPAARTAIALLQGLRGDPPDVAPAPPLSARAAVSWGEILVDGRGTRHGMVINRAFRLVAIAPESFARVDGDAADRQAIPDGNRILADEEAAEELRTAGIASHFLGFARLKGFPGLHAVHTIET